MRLDFYSVSAGTRVRLPWRHDAAAGHVHRWLQAGSSRALNDAGCSVCRGYLADESTSLASLAPQIAGEWSVPHNEGRTPNDVTPGSRKVAVWRCSQCDYVWTARISSRALDGTGCPRCAGQAARPGDDVTLAVAHDELYAELDHAEVEARGIDPVTLHARSNRQVQWICRDAGHRWTASPAARMNGCTCPVCPALGRTSAAERRLLDLVARRFGEAAGDRPAGDTRWTNSRGHRVAARCDIVVDSKRLVIEYDGLRYHRSPDRRRCDTDKTVALLAQDWRVVRIRERAGTRALSNLDLVSSGLLQISHRYADPLAPLVDQIVAWLDRLDG
jgi:hypothetical protein